MAFRRGSFTLTPPTMPVFTIAVVLALLGALLRYRVIALNGLGQYSFELVLAAVVLLILGALLRGV